MTINIVFKQFSKQRAKQATHRAVVVPAWRGSNDWKVLLFEKALLQVYLFRPGGTKPVGTVKPGLHQHGFALLNHRIQAESSVVLKRHRSPDGCRRWIVGQHPDTHDGGLFIRQADRGIPKQLQRSKQGHATVKPGPLR